MGMLVAQWGVVFMLGSWQFSVACISFTRRLIAVVHCIKGEDVACRSCLGCVSCEGGSMAMLSTKMLMEAINVNFAVKADIVADSGCALSLVGLLNHGEPGQRL
jgi:hypothetical protein